jgi:hypothetical protein
MAKAPFPRRRADGSFDLFIRLSGIEFEQSRLSEWIDRWVTRNQSRTRIWEGGGRKRKEVLTLADEFGGPPNIETVTRAVAVLRWPVLPQSKKLWRDWMVWFVSDFVKDHPGAKLDRVGQGTSL